MKQVYDKEENDTILGAELQHVLQTLGKLNAFGLVWFG